MADVDLPTPGRAGAALSGFFATIFETAAFETAAFEAFGAEAAALEAFGAEAAAFEAAALEAFGAEAAPRTARLLVFFADRFFFAAMWTHYSLSRMMTTGGLAGGARRTRG
jgi:hypothetical protein